MIKADAILEYLRNIGAKKEAEMSLKLFKSVEPHRFALVSIDSQTLAANERDVAFALAYLSSLGLNPTVIHDATGALGKQLVSDIWANGGKCQPIITGIFSGKANARSISEKAKELISRGTIPAIVTENHAETLNQLLKEIKPGKLVILNRQGGVRTRKGELLSYINLPNEYASISKTAAAEYKGVLKTAAGAIASADWKLRVEIVPPNGLLTELFTIKGSGTFVKKGPKIYKLGSDEVDKEKLKRLLEESFGRKLGDSYFETSRKENATFFVEERYLAAAIVKKLNGLSYIDKLAVLPEVQGEGLARDMITGIMNSCGKAFWRARPDNHINEWYLKLCSGMQKIKKWHIYWSNLNTCQIKEAIKCASKKPADFASWQ